MLNIFILAAMVYILYKLGRSVNIPSRDIVVTFICCFAIAILIINEPIIEIICFFIGFNLLFCIYSDVIAKYFTYIHILYILNCGVTIPKMIKCPTSAYIRDVSEYFTEDYFDYKGAEL